MLAAFTWFPAWYFSIEFLLFAVTVFDVFVFPWVLTLSSLDNESQLNILRLTGSIVFKLLKKKSQILNLFGVLRETIKGLSIQSLAYLGLRRFCYRCPFVFFVLFCFLLNSAIVSHHLLSQSGSYFKQIQAEVDPVRHSKMPVTSLRLKDKLLISSISMRTHVCLRER